MKGQPNGRLGRGIVPIVHSMSIQFAIQVFGTGKEEDIPCFPSPSRFLKMLWLEYLPVMEDHRTGERQGLSTV